MLLHIKNRYQKRTCNGQTMANPDQMKSQFENAASKLISHPPPYSIPAPISNEDEIIFKKCDLYYKYFSAPSTFDGPHIGVIKLFQNNLTHEARLSFRSPSTSYDLQIESQTKPWQMDIVPIQSKTNSTTVKTCYLIRPEKNYDLYIRCYDIEDGIIFKAEFDRLSREKKIKEEKEKRKEEEKRIEEKNKEERRLAGELFMAQFKVPNHSKSEGTEDKDKCKNEVKNDVEKTTEEEKELESTSHKTGEEQKQAIPPKKLTIEQVFAEIFSGPPELRKKKKASNSPATNTQLNQTIRDSEIQTDALQSKTLALTISTQTDNPQYCNIEEQKIQTEDIKEPQSKTFKKTVSTQTDEPPNSNTMATQTDEPPNSNTMATQTEEPPSKSLQVLPDFSNLIKTLSDTLDEISNLYQTDQAGLEHTQKFEINQSNKETYKEERLDQSHINESALIIQNNIMEPSHSNNQKSLPSVKLETKIHSIEDQLRKLTTEMSSLKNLSANKSQNYKQHNQEKVEKRKTLRNQADPIRIIPKLMDLKIKPPSIHQNLKIRYNQLNPLAKPRRHYMFSKQINRLNPLHYNDHWVMEQYLPWWTSTSPQPLYPHLRRTYELDKGPIYRHRRWMNRDLG